MIDKPLGGELLHENGNIETKFYSNLQNIHISVMDVIPTEDSKQTVESQQISLESIAQSNLVESKGEVIMKKIYKCPHCSKELNSDGGYYRGLGIGSIRVGSIYVCYNEDCGHYEASYYTVDPNDELHEGCPY